MGQNSNQLKAQIIAAKTLLLDEQESAAVEERVLGRAGRLTPGSLRHATGQAVMEAAPGKARDQREHAAGTARVEQWAEDSGNAALAGRELPPAEALAAGQRVTWWARQLRKAGLDGDLDQLRARALIDLILDRDSRPGHDSAFRDRTGHGRTGQPGTAPGASVLPAGFTGTVNLTIPVTTALGLASRPGLLAGTGPVDPWLARDLAAAAAASPTTRWCVTFTDQEGHAVAHGCARPSPENHRKQQHRENRGGPAPPPGHPGFAFTRTSRDGPPGGHGTWMLRTPGPGPDLLVEVESLDTGTCDHRHQARGHDPGTRLRHLAQIRHAECTSPVCRRPAAACDYEHNTPYEAGGRTCLCNGGPKCRHDHRLKQHPRWKVDQLPDGTFAWTTPSGRQYTTEPTRYPI